jgi:hypothetical protein
LAIFVRGGEKLVVAEILRAARRFRGSEHLCGGETLSVLATFFGGTIYARGTFCGGETL